MFSFLLFQFASVLAEYDDENIGELADDDPDVRTVFLTGRSFNYFPVFSFFSLRYSVVLSALNSLEKDFVCWFFDQSAPSPLAALGDC